MLYRRFYLINLLAGFCFFTAGLLHAKLPGWFTADAAMEPLPAKLRRQASEAEILREETIITIKPSGEWTETQRRAVRIRASEGSAGAQIYVPYSEKSDKIISANAWILRQNKKIKTYPRGSWLDIASAADYTLYTDFRFLAHSYAARDSSIGDVYGAEVVVRRDNKDGQELFRFGGDYPLRRRRIEFRVPRGWEVDLCWLSGNGPAPSINADRTVWAWELQDLPANQQGPWSPEDSASHRAAITVHPPEGVTTTLPRLKTWQDFASWHYHLQQPQCDSTPALTAKAASLCSGLTDPWDRMTALAKFAQKQTYVQEYKNNGLGFGYRPRRASEVLAAGYGDCKDKANLLVALLQQIGVNARLAIVLVEEGIDVKPEWPGGQFNHAIVAITLPDGVTHPASIRHPVFGHVLFFDPTQPYIPFGQLPWYEHGRNALICDPRETGLTQMPNFPPEEANGRHAVIELYIGQRGVLQGLLSETTRGEMAALRRAEQEKLSSGQRKERVIDSLSAAVPGVKVTVPEITEQPDSSLQSNCGFAAPSFGQLLNQHQLLVRLDVLSRNTVPSLPDERRDLPVVIPVMHDSQEVRFALPDASEVPELPEAQSTHNAFGHSESHYSVEEGWLVYRRTIELTGGTIPKGKYQALRDALIAFSRADSTAVVIQLKDAPKRVDQPDAVAAKP